MPDTRFNQQRLPKNRIEFARLFSLREYLFWLDASKVFQKDISEIKKKYTLLHIKVLSDKVFDELSGLFERYYIPFTDLYWLVIWDYLAKGRQSLERNYHVTVNLGFNEPRDVRPIIRQADLMPSITIDFFGKPSKKDWKDLWHRLQDIRLLPPESKSSLPHVGFEPVFMGDKAHYISRIQNGIDGLLEVHRLKLGDPKITWKRMIDYLESEKSISDYHWNRDTLRADYSKFRDVLKRISGS